MTVSALHLYPVKACRGHSLESLPVLKGPGWDRRWMVVNPKGFYFTLRQYPKLTLIETSLQDETLSMRLPLNKEYQLPVPKKGKKMKVWIWGQAYRAWDMGDEIGKELTDFLSTPCRLAFMPPLAQRTVKFQVSSDSPFETLSLISEASLCDLNTKLQSPVEMARFRPNIAIKEVPPYAEDSWRRLRIGEVVFDVIHPIARCIVINFDPIFFSTIGLNSLACPEFCRRVVSKT